MRDPLPEAAVATIAARAAYAERTLDLCPDVALMRSLGVLVAPLPTADGGAGLGTEPAGWAACFDLLRRLGAANLALARLVEGHINAAKLVALYAGEATRERAFAGVRAGRLLGVWGADAQPPVALRRDGGDVILSGAKRFASGLGSVADAIVTAATADGPQLVLVPVEDDSRADPGAWRQSGMRATLSGVYDLDGVRLPADALVGRPGDLLREPHFEGGVWRYCAAHLGGADALYALLVRRLVAAGRADDPHQARRVFEAASACETARLWIRAAAERVESGAGDPEAAAAYALMAREGTETACLTVIDRVERALGTAAFEEGSPVERIRRDLSLFLRQAAPDAKRARAARALVAAATQEAAT